MNIQPKFGHTAQVIMPADSSARSDFTKMVMVYSLDLQEHPEKECYARREGDGAVLTIHRSNVKIPLAGPEAFETADDIKSGNPFAMILHNQNLYLATGEQEQQVKEQLQVNA
jgi:hypothetical protein